MLCSVLSLFLILFVIFLWAMNVSYVWITGYVQDTFSFYVLNFDVTNFIKITLYFNALRNCITNHENIETFILYTWLDHLLILLGISLKISITLFIGFIQFPYVLIKITKIIFITHLNLISKFNTFLQFLLIRFN